MDPVGAEIEPSADSFGYLGARSGRVRYNGLTSSTTQPVRQLPVTALLVLNTVVCFKSYQLTNRYLIKKTYTGIFLLNGGYRHLY